MGYNTSYTLSIKNGSNDLIDELREAYDDADYAINSYGDREERCKWYDHEKHIKSFSIIHPDVLFVLEGDGEESRDIWVKYFQNGKMQSCKAKITFDEFNPEKLI
jgi:hypothetical protein